MSCQSNLETRKLTNENNSIFIIKSMNYILEF